MCFSKRGDAKAFSSGVISVEDFVTRSFGEGFVSVMVPCGLLPQCLINKCEVLDSPGRESAETITVLNKGYEGHQSPKQ